MNRRRCCLAGHDFGDRGSRASVRFGFYSAPGGSMHVAARASVQVSPGWLASLTLAPVVARS